MESSVQRAEGEEERRKYGELSVEGRGGREVEERLSPGWLLVLFLRRGA